MVFDIYVEIRRFSLNAVQGTYISLRRGEKKNAGDLSGCTNLTSSKTANLGWYTVA